jgi:hypothetical protein
MSNDLERALADLADAAERSARHGLLAEAALPFTLHRVIGKVRRRRAARAVGSGALALVVLTGAAGALNAGLDVERPQPPATVPTSVAERTAFCGVSDEDVARTSTLDDTLELRNLTTAVVTTAEPFRFVVQGVNRSSRPLVVGQDRDGRDTVLLMRGGTVVAAGFVASPVWDRSLTIGSGEALTWDGPAVVDDCAARDGVTRAPVGDYEMWLLSDLDIDGTDARTVGGPWPITLIDAPSTPVPTLWPSPSICEQPDEALAELADPTRYPVPLGFSAPTPGASAVDVPPGLTATLGATGDETPAILSVSADIVLVRDHVIVGGTSLEPDAAGGYGTYAAATALRACPPGGDARSLTEAALVDPGEYGAWVVASVFLAGSTEETLVIAGPWALTLTEPGVDPVAEAFRCGAPLTFTAGSLPDAGGLTLTADLPADGWRTFGMGPAWSATLGTDAGRTILANVSTPLHVALTDDDGVVVGRTFSGDVAVDLYTAGPDASTVLPGTSEVAGCGASLAPGTYWAWPFAEAVLKEVQEANAEAFAPPAGVEVVIGAPTRVTLTD